MKLSVIVPVYNREHLIGAALRSLLRQQEDVDLDIIVIDDGSTDGTRDVVSGLSGQAPCIRLLTQPNRGVAAARNTGLRALLPQTGFVSFLDSDDISPAGRFRTDLAHFASDPALDIVYSLVATVDRFDEGGLEPLGIDGPPARHIQLAAAIFRRRLIDRAGFFDESFEQADDTDLLFRIFEQKPHSKFSEMIGVYYRKHRDSLMARRDVVRREYLRAYHKAALRKAAAVKLDALPAPLPERADSDAL